MKISKLENKNIIRKYYNNNFERHWWNQYKILKLPIIPKYTIFFNLEECYKKIYHIQRLSNSLQFSWVVIYQLEFLLTWIRDIFQEP